MADLVEDRVGQQLGNYRLLRLLSQDNSAQIYLGEHIFLKTQAAIKVLLGPLSQQALEAFLAETRSIARLKHPNILRILEFGVEGNIPFLVTDYAPHGSLRQRHPRGTTVPPAIIITYVKQIASALQYIHDQGLVHRSVRPEHMLPGFQDRILLSDFDQAIGIQDAVNAEAEALKYMAPEQLTGQPEAASDQYALGVVVYEWLSGDTPFQNSASAIREQHRLAPIALSLRRNQKILSQLESVVMKALAEDPRQRFASVTAFAQALEQAIQPTLLASSSLSAPVKPRPVRQIATGIGISLAIVALLVIGGGLLYNTGLFPFARPTASTISPAQATQTAQARATQGAIATITAKSPEEIYAIATGGQPLINDPLNNQSSSTWEHFRINNGDGSCLFSDGAYHLHVQGNNYLNCLSQGESLHNFAYEVQMRLIEGEEGGIVFRYSNPTPNSDEENFYALRLTPLGNSSIFCSLWSFKSEKRLQLQSCQFTGNPQSSNLITVIAYDHTFYFYWNKAFLMKVEDDVLESGLVGVTGSAVENGTTECVFSNAKVWKL